MRKLTVFNNVTLDGYFTGANGDLSWAHASPQDDEWKRFIAGNAKGNSQLVFGRVTYELMIKYWPTPMAMQQNPILAERMNNASKIVFSKTLSQATWNNTQLIKGDLISDMRKLKEAPGDSMTILGSGSVVSQLAAHGLIDEYQMVIVPVALGQGRSMFDGGKDKLSFKLAQSRAFKNGNVFLSYERKS